MATDTADNSRRESEVIPLLLPSSLKSDRFATLISDFSSSLSSVFCFFVLFIFIFYMVSCSWTFLIYFA